MYYNPPAQFRLLQISDDFASLRHVGAGNLLTFEFRYKISQSSAIKHNAMIVEATVFTRTVTKRPILGRTKFGQIDSRQVIKNILSDMPEAKSAAKNKENYVIHSRKHDISSLINNEIVGDLRRGIHPTYIQKMYSNQLKTVTAGELKENNNLHPIIDILDLKVENIALKVSASLEEDTQKLCHDLILRRGIDPSEVQTISSKMLHASESYLGTLRPRIRHEAEEGTLMRLHDHLILRHGVNDVQSTTVEVEDHKLVNIIVNEPHDDVEAVMSFKFTPPVKKPKSKDTTDVFVKFQLLDPNTGSAIDEIIKPLDVPRHLSIFYTPVHAPIVKLARSKISSRANLEILQMSPNADQVLIYRKNVYTADVHIDDYNLVGVYPCQFAHRTTIQVNLPTYDAAIYRVIPANKRGRGFLYASAVIKPQRYRPVRAISLTSKTIDNGILIEARRLPPDAVSIQFLQRNLTIHEKDFSPVDVPKFISNTVRHGDHLSVITLDVQDHNVYEFAVKLYHRGGEQIITANEIQEYVSPAPGKVDIKISNVTVSHGDEPNVTFNVAINMLDKDIDHVKSLLERHGIKSYFEDDIMNHRDQLKSLLAYSVHRIDLFTGDREDMGIVTVNSFSDNDISKNFASKPLKYGHKYRYIVSAVARAPEPMFELTEKKLVDQVTKKPYSFKPHKFLHPIALRRGLLLSPSGLKTLYTKSALAHGELGTYTEIEVSLDPSPVQIVEANASKFDHYNNIITWRYQGDIASCDHFVIMKDVHGIRKVLGTAHTDFSHHSAQWLHHLTSTDKGEIRYVIVPILNDFKHGQPIVTNDLLIEES